MSQRFALLGAAVLALVWATASPARVSAQHGHGGFHSGFRSDFGARNRGFSRRFFQPGFGDFDRRFFDPRFGTFDGRFYIFGGF